MVGVRVGVKVCIRVGIGVRVGVRVVVRLGVRVCIRVGIRVKVKVGIGVRVGLGLGLRHDALKTSVSNNFVHIRRTGIRQNGAEPFITHVECSAVRSSSAAEDDGSNVESLVTLTLLSSTTLRSVDIGSSLSGTESPAYIGDGFDSSSSSSRSFSSSSCDASSLSTSSWELSATKS